MLTSYFRHNLRERVHFICSETYPLGLYYCKNHPCLRKKHICTYTNVPFFSQFRDERTQCSETGITKMAHQNSQMSSIFYVLAHKSKISCWNLVKMAHDFWVQSEPWWNLPSVSICKPSSSFNEALLSGEVGDRNSSTLELSLLDIIISLRRSFTISWDAATSSGVLPCSLGCNGLAPCFNNSSTSWNRCKQIICNLKLAPDLPDYIFIC